jgi:hypothetical protein
MISTSQVVTVKKNADASIFGSTTGAGGMIAARVDEATGIDSEGATELEFTDDDLATTIRVVTSISSNIHAFLRLATLKPLRAALHPLILAQIESSYGETVANAKRTNKKRKGRGWTSKDADDIALERELEAKRKAKELEYINSTKLRAIRMKQLEDLTRNEPEEVRLIERVPDGVAILDGGLDDGSSAPSPRLLYDRATAEQNTTSSSSSSALVTSFHHVTTGAMSLSPSCASSASSASKIPKELRESVKCYICRKPYRQLHFFYHSLCPECAHFNFSKREEKCDLHGRVVLVTGGRTKIGFRCTLKLLRCGARCIVTTRFPADALVRYRSESDSASWIDRLELYGLDFRDMSSLERFCEYASTRYERLDAIINNAAQTIRRPPAYYAHLLPGEQQMEALLIGDQSSVLKAGATTTAAAAATRCPFEYRVDHVLPYTV